METDDCIYVDEEKDEDDDSLPTANECMKLCETFAEFTETDKALAMMYLQQASWNLELALASFYDGTGDQAPATSKRSEHTRQPRPGRQIAPNSVSAATPVCTSDAQHAHLFRVLSWNIDGLSEKSCIFRTEAVINTIQTEVFHVVCLQEVVRATLSMLERDLSALYNIFYPSDAARRDYFPVICVLKHQAISVDPASFRVSLHRRIVYLFLQFFLCVQLVSSADPVIMQILSIFTVDVGGNPLQQNQGLFTPQEDVSGTTMSHRGKLSVTTL
ncbi:unnamed protein product [Dibothriocephalus latus]|uniref:Uncharacterized protein n=1 Tax=Dibothriocephalus latus TaxID=60516 RepID=A0A3P7M1U9_DIBLA|nr:unnamed protein product [Dibothriocephalus latus]